MMTRLNLQDDYVAGGYFISRYFDRTGFWSAELLPARLITVSGCIAPFMPDVWSISWASGNHVEKEHACGAFGLRASQLPKLTQWVNSRVDEKKIGFPNVCMSLEVARELMAMFLPHDPNVVLLGIGLHRKFVDEILNDNASDSDIPADDGDDTPRSGVYESLRQAKPLGDGGDVLGFELLGYEHTGAFHSWLCNGLEKKLHRAIRIKPNQHGFIPSAADAEKGARYIRRNDIGAEPATWLPWMVVKYASEQK